MTASLETRSLGEDTNLSPNGRLLVVDDEPAVLKLVKTMLGRAQYDVTICGSAIEGLRLMDDNPFDCVITDAIMPVMTGYELVKAIRRHPVHAAVPVLMLTRKRHRQDVKKAVEVGVTDYVLKPIDEHLLLDKVELCLKKGTGTKHTFELSIAGEQSLAELKIDCRIITISETEMTMRLPFPVAELGTTTIASKLFDEIGIQMPYLSLVCCDRGPAIDDFRGFDYEARFAFVGVREADLMKIRAWLQKEAIRRRK